MSSAPAVAREIFTVAVEQYSPEQWSSYLDEACGDNRELRNRVELLLEAHLGEESVLNSPAIAPTPSLDQPITQKPGTQIGPYTLLQQLGEGGMGVVYMAEQEEPVKRRVALKIIKPGMDSRQVIARFEAERQALSLMDHLNIARVLDAGTTDTGRPYFVMELVLGLPITEYCEEQQLSPRQRLELILPICQAVQHAHHKGIIHRDIKPSNVLVGEYDGRPIPKVIDFGVAKAISQPLTDKTMFTGLGQIVGTLEYMSPEQANVNPVDIDTRSDIYSLGVLIYELLTGTTPFDKSQLRSAGWDEMLRIIREEEPPRPSTRLSGCQDSLPSRAAPRLSEPAKLAKMVRGELDWIVMKALEKDRHRRYATASGLADDIQHYLQNEPVSACPPSALYRFRKFASRNRTLLVAGATVTAALIAGLGVSTWLYFRERAAVERADQNLRQATQEADRADRLRREAEANAVRAGAEASKSELVAEFMTEMLRGAAPWVARGRDTTLLREILDQTAKRLDRLGNQPAVEADLRETLGDVYMSLEDYQSAEKMHRQALNLRIAMFGEQHLDVATSFLRLGDTVRQLQRTDEAEVLIRKSLELRRKLLGDEHPEVGVASWYLGLVLIQQERASEAESVLRQVLALRQKLFDSDDHRVVGAQGTLAQALVLQGKDAEAEPLYRASLASHRKQYHNEDHPALAIAISSLANLLARKGELDEAEKLFREAFEMRKKLLPELSTSIEFSRLGLARVLRQQGKLAEAELLFREAVEVTRRRSGSDHPDLVPLLSELRNVLNNQGKKEQADALVPELIALQQKALATAPPDRVVSFIWASLIPNQKYAEAHELLHAALSRVGDGDSASRVALGRMCRQVGERAYHVSDFDTAERACRLAITTLQPIVAEHPTRETTSDLGQCLFYLSSMLYNSSRDDEGATVAQLGVIALEESAARIPDDTGFRGTLSLCRRNLAHCLARQGNYEQAVSSCREWVRLSLELRAENQGGKDEPNYLNRACTGSRELATYLKNAGQLEQAIAEFRKAMELSEQGVAEFPDFSSSSGSPTMPGAFQICNWNCQVELATCLLQVGGNHREIATLLDSPDFSRLERQVCLGAALNLQRFLAAMDTDDGDLSTIGPILKNKARRLLDESLRRPPSFPAGKNDLARALLVDPPTSREDAERAVTLARQAVAEISDLAAYWTTLGIACFRNQDYPAALEALEKSLQLSKGGKGLDFLLLAMTHWQLGHQEEARSRFEQAATWIEQNQASGSELRAYRREAAKLLGILDSPTTKHNLTEPMDPTSSESSMVK